MENQPKTSKTLNYIILWIAQAFLAVTFIWAGYMKLFASIEELNKMWTWTTDNATLVKFTGVFDLLAGVGLVLPALLRIQPKLIIYAAYGTIGLMISASIFHISRNEAEQIGFNIFVTIIAAFIAWGRQKKVPFASK
jgi:putative oxidoreductase